MPNGAYSPSLDKLEQGLDLIKEIVTSVDLQLEVDVAIFIDVGADGLYDEVGMIIYFNIIIYLILFVQDKGKYELVAGQWKTTDEIISIYFDLLRSSSGLLGFIDPLHPKVINSDLNVTHSL